VFKGLGDPGIVNVRIREDEYAQKDGTSQQNRSLTGQEAAFQQLLTLSRRHESSHPLVTRSSTRPASLPGPR
jgi:hypothetical protein